jgi:hypothetical protein
MTEHAVRSHLTSCEHGSMCVDDRPGHAMSLIRLRLAACDQRGWLDATVDAAGEDGWVTLRPFHGGEPVRVWQHLSLAGVVAPGHPVALNTAYSVLAVGTQRYNVLQESRVS